MSGTASRNWSRRWTDCIQGIISDYKLDFLLSQHTWNGLIGNVESGHVTTSLDHMKYNVTEFERYFEMGEDITTPMIEAIEESWIFQVPVKPYLAYLRGLLEVFGNVASVSRSETYHLADFQQMIVASAINSLNEFRRAMVISPTGTGKTVMGSYIIASECTDANRKVVIFSPNEAVKRKWNMTACIR